VGLGGGGFVMCGSVWGVCNVWVCVGGFCNVWVCVGGVLVTRVLAFTAFLCCFVHVYLFLFLLPPPLKTQLQ
jgi:hypothetical protein